MRDRRDEQEPMPGWVCDPAPGEYDAALAWVRGDGRSALEWLIEVHHRRLRRLGVR